MTVWVNSEVVSRLIRIEEARVKVSNILSKYLQERIVGICRNNTTSTQGLITEGRPAPGTNSRIDLQQTPLNFLDACPSQIEHIVRIELQTQLPHCCPKSRCRKD
ncbi:hypothetical protein M0812_22957 [Anaeramoeba flamelloides]|uniref:Uncharacterized protein n=1 Tax=Anaeramoeba flamelloides TaxID=1746091 RepID=A0AAV7YJD2_9EUKA|nr:hypothetical protein M0812_22957 [Anaeramoeba flamelloides]